MSLSVDQVLDRVRENVGLFVRDGSIRTEEQGARSVPMAAIYPEWLGDAAFAQAHGARFNYVVGEMARGIATPKMVIEAVRAGCVGFYGSAGLKPETIEEGVREIKAGIAPGQTAWGANLIHSPQQPGYEARVVDLFLSMGVRRVSASAYMRLSPEIVRYTAQGLSRSAEGHIMRANHVFAKVSRAEVATQFMQPAPDKILKAQKPGSTPIPSE